jgi:hypothetical protein
MLVIDVFGCVATKLSLLPRHIALPDLGSGWTVGDTFGRLVGLENGVLRSGLYEVLRRSLATRIMEAASRIGGPCPSHLTRPCG